MAHNKDILLPSLLSDTAVIAQSQLQELDQRASESINGDEGGIWTPESQISIGGDGVEFDNVGFIRGGVTSKGQGLNPSVSFEPGHWPTHNPAKTLRVVFPIRAGLWNNYDNIYNIENWGAQNGVLRFTKYDNTMTMMVPLDMRKFPFSGKISSITLNFKAGISMLPANYLSMVLVTKAAVSKYTGYPVMRIEPWKPTTVYKQYDFVIPSTFVSDNYTNPFAYVKLNSGSSLSGTTEPAGFATNQPVVFDGSITWTAISLKNTGNIVTYFQNKYPIPATEALWYNGGNPKSFTVSNINVFPKVVNHDYVLYIQDMTRSRNLFTSLVVNFTDITQMRNV